MEEWMLCAELNSATKQPESASASKQSATIRVSTLLPAEKASAEAALAEAQVDLDKTSIRAGFAGWACHR